MAKITINEALNWKKTLGERHAELISLRNQNSAHVTQYYGANADKTRETKPQYSVVKLDRMVARLAREQRLLDNAIKRTNAMQVVNDYDQDDTVLGELEAVEA